MESSDTALRAMEDSGCWPECMMIRGRFRLRGIGMTGRKLLRSLAVNVGPKEGPKSDHGLQERVHGLQQLPVARCAVGETGTGST